MQSPDQFPCISQSWSGKKGYPQTHPPAQANSHYQLPLSWILLSPPLPSPIPAVHQTTQSPLALSYPASWKPWSLQAESQEPRTELISSLQTVWSSPNSAWRPLHREPQYRHKYEDVFLSASHTHGQWLKRYQILLFPFPVLHRRLYATSDLPIPHLCLSSLPWGSHQPAHKSLQWSGSWGYGYPASCPRDISHEVHPWSPVIARRPVGIYLP